MKKLIILFIGISFFLPGCAYPFRYDGTYKGKVIDADTEQPIEGVVVLGVWETVTITPAGGTHDYYDAKETATNKNGEFEISGKGLRILSNLEPMTAYIFKAGYTYEVIDWTELFRKLHEKIKWEDDKAIIPLKKLTMEERRESLTFPPYPPTEAPQEKIKLMMEEIYKERKERGLD
jgi:hypothetical protein